MKRFLIPILLLFSILGGAQDNGVRQTYWQLLSGPVITPTTCTGLANLTSPAIASTTDFQRIGGYQNWQGNDGCQVVPMSYNPMSNYHRFTWSDLESSTVQGNYTKIWFDPNEDDNIGRMRKFFMDAADAGRLASFGIMQLYPGPDLGGHNDIYNYNGAYSVYPKYVHDAMQASGVGDFSDNDNTTPVWIPNYNNATWRARWRALNVAVNNWMDTATYTPGIGPKVGQLVRFKDMVLYIDIRGLGSYGEGHHCCLSGGYDVISNWPAGRFATVATMKEIIDIGADSYPTYPTVIIINWMDGGFDNGNGLNNTKIPVEVGIYALTKTNTHGKIGLRRDQVGNNEQYYHTILENNNMQFGGVRADTAIANRYLYNYFVGEPQGGPPFDCPDINMGCSPGQVRRYHMYSFGNGNYGGCAGVPVNTPGHAGADSVRTAFRLAGARIQINSGTMTANLVSGCTFNITSVIQNIGYATEQRNWTATYQLRNASNVTVWTGTFSNFSVKGFAPLPVGTPISQNFTLPTITPGVYRLVIKINDPTGYLDPYPLGQTVRESDGAYQLRTNINVS